jgi:hypothetical protein
MLGKPFVEDGFAALESVELMSLGEALYRTVLHLLGIQDTRSLQQARQVVFGEGFSVKCCLEALPLIRVEREVTSVGQDMLSVVERGAANELARGLLRRCGCTLKRGFLRAGDPDLEAFGS